MELWNQVVSLFELEYSSDFIADVNKTSASSKQLATQLFKLPAVFALNKLLTEDNTFRGQVAAAFIYYGSNNYGCHQLLLIAPESIQNENDFRCLNWQIKAREDKERHSKGLKSFSCLIATKQTWVRISSNLKRWLQN